jgi:hypothetical protein
MSESPKADSTGRAIEGDREELEELEARAEDTPSTKRRPARDRSGFVFVLD